MTITVKDANGANVVVQTLPAPGISVAASALPVVLASDQSNVPVSVGNFSFSALRPQTYSLTVGPTATTTPVQFPPVAGATSYRVRNAAASASPITWVLSTTAGTAPIIPTPYGLAGTGGVVGDKTIDAGGVEVFQLSAAQQTALAAGTLYWSAITPAGGSGVLSVTFGIGA